MKEYKNKSIEEYEALIINQLLGIDNLDLLIIKSHILLEYSINLLLESISKKPDPDFFSENFTFSNKLAILKHFGYDNDFLVEEINLINKLRNDIAHRLTFNERHLQDFFRMINKKDPENTEKRFPDVLHRYKSAMVFILGALFSTYILNKGGKKEIDTYLEKRKR